MGLPRRAAYALPLLVGATIAASAVAGPRPIQPRVGWVRITEAVRDGSRWAVLRNPGPGPITLTMQDGTVVHTLLTRTKGGWRITGPIFFCGVGMRPARLAVGDSVSFRVLSHEISPNEQPLRVAVHVTDVATNTSFYASSPSMRLSTP